MLYLVLNSIYKLSSLPAYSSFFVPLEAGAVWSFLPAHDRKSQFSSSGLGFFYDDLSFS